MKKTIPSPSARKKRNIANPAKPAGASRSREAEADSVDWEQIDEEMEEHMLDTLAFMEAKADAVLALCRKHPAIRRACLALWETHMGQKFIPCGRRRVEDELDVIHDGCQGGDSMELLEACEWAAEEELGKMAKAKKQKMRAVHE